MLISFEGGDRCGKTTQIELLKKRIEEIGVKVVALKHPNRSTASGKIIDAYLKREIELSNEAITLCLTSNLWESSMLIKEYLKQGYVVLIDRYIHTNLAYSQIRGVNVTKLEKMMEGMIQPDIVIYLRAEDTSDRKDFGAERYETVEIHKQVIKNFDEIFRKDSRPFNLLKINSNKPIEEVTNEIWDGIKGQI